MLWKNKRNLIDLTKDFFFRKIKTKLCVLWLLHLYLYPLQRIYKIALKQCYTDKLQNKQKYKYCLFLDIVDPVTHQLWHIDYHTAQTRCIQVVCTTRCNIGSKESRTFHLLLKILHMKSVSV